MATVADKSGSNRSVDQHFNSRKQVQDISDYVVLLNKVSVIGQGPDKGPINGGDYILRVEADNWNGATATLKVRKLNGTGYYTAKTDANADITFTADGQVALGIAQGATVAIAVTGTAPTNMTAVLGGMD